MAASSRWYDHNLSRVELIVALLLISIFIGLFAIRALKVFALAEKSHVILTVNNMNAAMNYRALLSLAKKDHLQIGELGKMNPIQLVYKSVSTKQLTNTELIEELQYPIVNAPANYLGEIDDPELQEIKPGHWFFDRSDNKLIYIVKNTEFFTTSLDGPERIRFNIKLDYTDINGNHEFDQGIDQFNSIKLESIDSFHWDL